VLSGDLMFLMTKHFWWHLVAHLKEDVEEPKTFPAWLID
jgi:hypothetical protein